MNLKSWFLLVFLFSLTHCLEPQIDLTRCEGANPENYCLIRGSCVASSTDAADKEKLVQLTPNDALKNRTCDVIVQIKPYSKAKWHVMMQINGTDSNTKLNPEKGMELFHKESQFSCSKSLGVKVNHNKFTESEGLTPIFNEDLMFCSFKVTSAALQIAKTFFLDDEYDKSAPALHYSLKAKDDPIKMLFPIKGAQMWTIFIAKCNPDFVSTKVTNLWPWVMTEIETIRLSFKCDPGKKIIVSHNGLYEVDSLNCVNGKFQFTTGGKTVEIADDKTFEAFCGVRQTCSPLKHLDCTGCDKNDNNLTSCPDNTWRLKYDGKEDDGRVVVTTLQCNQSTKSGAGFTGGWFAKDETREITAGSCSNKFDCKQFSNLTNECPEGKECTKPNYSSDNRNINCTDGYTMKIGDQTGTSLSCKEENGLYYDDKGEKAEKSNVFCEKTADTGLQTGSTSMVAIGGGIAGALFLIIIAAFCVFICKRRRKNKDDGNRNRNTHTEMRTGIATESKKIVLEDVTASTERPSDKPTIPIVQEEKVPEKVSDGKKRREEEKRLAALTPEEQNYAILSKMLEKWNLDYFDKHIAKNFPGYPLVLKQKCLETLTTFQGDTCGDYRDSGTLDQIYHLIKFIHTTCHCNYTWEHIFRVIKIFHYAFATMRNDKYHVADRIMKMFAPVGHTNIAKYGYEVKERQSLDDALMQMVAIRMMLYMKNPECIERVKALAAQPLPVFDHIKRCPPIYMPVFSYAANHMGKEPELKALLYQELERNKKAGPTIDPGTLRQTLLFALCSTRNRGAPDEKATLKEMINLVNERDPATRHAAFTPTDLLYAWRGATDDPSMRKAAVELFKKHPIKDCEKYVTSLVNEMRGTEDERKKLTTEFKRDLIEMCLVIAESTINEKEAKGVLEAMENIVKYAGTPERTINSQRFMVRAEKMYLLADLGEISADAHDFALGCWEDESTRKSRKTAVK